MVKAAKNSKTFIFQIIISQEMPIQGDLYKWNEESVNAIAEKAGVYAFFDEKKNLIYIGEATNLRERFQGYWRTNFSKDPCKKATKSYRREFTELHKDREKELLEEYKRNNDGKLPKCNDILA